MRPLLLLICLLALLASCAPAPAPPQAPPGATTPVIAPSSAPSPLVMASGPVTITFGVDQYELATYEPLAQRFMAEQSDITVQIVPLPEPDIGTDGTFQIEGFQRRVAEAADSFNAWFNTDEALQADLLLDLAPLIDADPSFDRADFLPGAITPRDGTISSIPRYLFTPLYAYNRDLLARRGVSEPPPDASFAQLLERAEQVAVVGDDSTAIYGIWNYEIALDALTVLLRERGIDLGDGAPPLSDPRYADALAKLETLVSTNAVLYESFARRSNTLNDNRSYQLIERGQVAIWPAQEYSYGARGLPDYLGFLPMRDAVTDAPQLFADNSYAISAGTQHPEAAWRWVSFLSRQYLPLDSGNFGFLPARRSLLEQHWQGIGDAELAVMRPLVERLEAPPPTAAGTWQWALHTAIEQLLEANESIPAALDAAERAFQEAQLAVAAPTPTPDPRPVVVATPQPVAAPAAGARTVRFGVASHLSGPIRSAATTFNSAQSEVAVVVSAIDGGADSSPAALASQFDCFVTNAYEPAGDATLDLQPLIDADPTFDVRDYPPVLLEQLREDGRLTGLPLTMELPLLIYNIQRFAEAGIVPPGAGWTLDDLVAAAERLTDGSGADQRFGLGAADAGMLLFFLERSGVELARTDGSRLRPQFTDPATVAAIQRFVAVVRQTTPSARMSGYSANPNDPAAAAATQSGRVAMWLGATTNLPYAEGSALPVVLAPLPLADGQLPGVTVNQALYIAANNPQPEACWRWIQALSASAELDDGQRLPARRSLLGAASARPGIRAGTAELVAAYSAALAAPSPADEAAPWERGPVTSFWLLRAVDRALQGGDLERELADAQFLTEQYLNCVQGGERYAACARTIDPTYVGWGEAPR